MSFTIVKRVYYNTYSDFNLKINDAYIDELNKYLDSILPEHPTVTLENLFNLIHYEEIPDDFTRVVTAMVAPTSEQTITCTFRELVEDLITEDLNQTTDIIEGSWVIDFSEQFEIED